MNTYSPEFKAAVVADYQAGMTFAEIATARNIGTSTVGKWVKEAGIPVRPPVRRTLPITCNEEGCTRKYKARGYCNLHYGRHILGHKPRENSYSTINADERLEDVRWMAETGEHLDGAAERLGITVKALERFLRRYDRDCLALLIEHRPRDHNRSISGASVGQITGQTERRRRRRERQKVAA